MGHYDNCYASEREDIDEAKEKELNEKIKKFLKKSNLTDKEFIGNIIENIEDYKIFFSILKQK